MLTDSHFIMEVIKMTIQEMLKRKTELGYTYAQLSELSGVPVGTIQKIFSGVTSSPRYETLRALEQVLKKPENSYKVKKQGEYTLDRKSVV